MWLKGTDEIRRNGKLEEQFDLSLRYLLKSVCPNNSGKYCACLLHVLLCFFIISNTLILF